jgi:hypothetical protein
MLTGICTWYRPDGRLSESEIIGIHTELALRGLAIDSSMPAKSRRATV